MIANTARRWSVETLALVALASACGGDLVEASDESSSDSGSDSDSDSSTGTDATSIADDTSASTDASTGAVIECGDGIAEGYERCDGADLAGGSCSSLGFELGELACADDCLTYDHSDCRNPDCGDQLAEGSEACDGTDLRGASCSSEGYDSGGLACADDCSALVVSGCGTCGDSVIAGDELCDADALGGESCEGLGYDSGTLQCLADCSALDDAGCGTCGNAIADGDEACDAADLGGLACDSLGWDSGALACAPDCTSIDESGCGLCGNAVVDGDEVCDGDALGAASCMTEGFDNGTLVCIAGCADLDTTGCGICGNGIIDGDEECDGIDLAGATCASLGFAGEGEPGCTASCTIATYTCCGDDGGGLTVQERIDAAVDDDVLYIGPTVENVAITGKRLTLRGNCADVTSTWSCADTNVHAIAVGSGADVTIDGFVFEGCDGGTLAAGGSGVIAATDAVQVVVRNSVFRNNAGYRGSVFTTHGGAMPADGLVVIENNIMHDNIADDGGVIYIFGDTNIQIRNNLVYANSAVDYCGAIWLRDQQQEKMEFSKNVVWGNTADRNPALEMFSGDGAIVDSSIVSGNSPSNVAAGWPNSFSLFGGNPMFVDPVGGDFTLGAGSTAIDAGNPALPLDLDGTVTDQGVRFDQLPIEP